MPTYLRWIAAITSGVTAWLTYSVLTLGISSGVFGVTELGGGAGALITFGSVIVLLLATLAVNDWLIRRYPRERAHTEDQRERI